MRSRFIAFGAAAFLTAACGQDKTGTGAQPTSSTTLVPPTNSGLVPPASKDSPDQAAVRKTFVAYQTALKSKNGEAAASLFDAGTVKAYETFVVQAQNLKREQLEKLELVELVNVLRLRHELTPEELAAAKGRAVLVRSVQDGWISDQSVLSGQIGRISVHDDRADVSRADKPFTPAFFFVREGGRWRYDMLRGQKRLEPGLRTMMGASKMEAPLAFAGKLIEKISANKPFDPKHLEGPPPNMPEPPPGFEEALNPKGPSQDHGHDHGTDHGHGHEHRDEHGHEH